MMIAKKRILLALTAVAMLICLSLGVAACKKNKGKEAFATPANVTVSGDTLSWDEVAGATSYTVKINSDETTSTEVTSLDLTTVTAKLVSGNNSLYVKANATEDKNASVYSAAVMYNYSPVTQLSAPTLMVNQTEKTVSWTAVNGATNGYTVKIGTQTLNVNSTSLDLTAEDAKALLVKGDNLISVKANAAGGLAESVYSNEVTYNHVLTPAEEAAEFKAAVDAIGEVMAQSESKIALARAKYDVLSEEAKAIEGSTAAIAALAEKECAYFAILADAVTVAGLDKDITVAEKVVVDAAIAKATGYFENLIDNTAAADANAAYGEKKSAYANLLTSIESDVDLLAEEIEATIKTDMPDKTGLVAYYNGLIAVQEKADGLGEYAATLLDGALTTAVDNEIKAVLKVPYEAQDEVEAFVNGANGTVTILHRAVNVIGETINDTAPALSVTIDDGTANGVDTSAAAFTNNNGEYYYTVNFITKGNIKDAVIDDDGVTVIEPATPPEYRLKVTYTIGDGEEQDVKYIEFEDDIYFTYNNGNPQPDDYYAIKGGNILFSGAGNDAYFDIYETKNISIGTNNNADPVITGFPLIKGVVVSNGISVEAFRKMLARDEEYSKILLDKTFSVRFVVYNKTVNGGIVMSNIKNSLVSHDVYVLDLTDEDAKERLIFNDGGMQLRPDLGEGTLEFGASYDAEALAAQFDDPAVTAANVHEQLRFVFEATLNGERTEQFSIDYTGGMIEAKIMRSYLFKAFGPVNEGVFDFNITLALREGSKYGNILKDSETRIRTTRNTDPEHPEYPDKTITVVSPVDIMQVQFSGSYFEFFRSPDSALGNGGIFNYGVDYVEFKFEKDGEEHVAYMIVSNELAGNPADGYKVFIYDNSEGAGTGLECGGVKNSYTTVVDFANWINGIANEVNEYPGDFNADGWSFSTKVHFDGDYGVTSNYTDTVTYNE